MGNKTNLRLKGNIELRATENLKLKDQIETIKKEVELLNMDNCSLKTTIQELTAQKDDLDRLRNSDMEMCLNLREKLAKAEEEVEKGESAVRSMEAQQVVVMQAEAHLEEEKVRGEEYLAVARKYQERLDEMEDLMKQTKEMTNSRRMPRPLRSSIRPWSRWSSPSRSSWRASSWRRTPYCPGRRRPKKR